MVSGPEPAQALSVQAAITTRITVKRRPTPPRKVRFLVGWRLRSRAGGRFRGLTLSRFIIKQLFACVTP